MPPKRPNRIAADGDVATVFVRHKGQEIPFTIDADDVERVGMFTWSLDGGGYAFHRNAVKGRPYSFSLHRFILNRGFVSDGNYVDHINRNRSDNRKCNLRVATSFQNAQNCATKSKIGIRGATFNKALNLYMAGCNHNRARMFLGWYKTADEAHHVTMTYLRQHDLIPT